MTRCAVQSATPQPPRNPQIGKTLMARTFFHTTNLTDEAETEVLVEYSASAYIPAQTYGPAENCHPAEGGEVEIINVCLANAVDAAGQNIPVVLTDADRERIETWLAENHEDDRSDDYDY